MPMWTANRIMLINDMSSSLNKPIANLMLNTRTSKRNAYVTRAIRQVIADNGSPGSCPTYNLLKRVHGFIFCGMLMGSYPIIHFCDVSRCPVSVQKLVSVHATTLGHKFGLSACRAAASGYTDTSIGESLLKL